MEKCKLAGLVSISTLFSVGPNETQKMTVIIFIKCKNNTLKY